jgi:tRNA uridine 5-carbamoylmethylation protein Kti12
MHGFNMNLIGCSFSSFDELVTRYEEPDGRNRWDSPLFTVIYDDVSVPQDNLWDAIILKKPPPPNLSTVTVSEGVIDCQQVVYFRLISPLETCIRNKFFI